jgi:carboxymethylenebutenolidase
MLRASASSVSRVCRATRYSASLRVSAAFSSVPGRKMSSGERTTFGEGVPAYVWGTPGQPGVVLLQEWWGVNEQVKRHAVKVASAGFRVLVPDLYKGVIGVNKEEASHHMSALDWGVAVKEIGQAAAFLKAEGSPKVGATGFCMGGALTLLGAATCADIVAAAPFYGIPRDERVDLSKLSKPVLGHFGELDNHTGFSDPESAKALADKLANGEVHIIPGVGHGYMNDTPEPYGSWEERQQAMGMVPFDAAAAEASWGRVLAFFNTHLKA